MDSTIVTMVRGLFANRPHLLWAQRAKTLVDGLDLDGIEGNELGRPDSVGLHVRQALEGLRFRIHYDGVHKLHQARKRGGNKQTTLVDIMPVTKMRHMHKLRTTDTKISSIREQPQTLIRTGSFVN